MKIIFLDIDGVLNHELFYRGYTKYPRKTIKRPLDQIDQGSVEILNDLIKETGAKVVISSTWRRHYTPEEMQGFLEHFGFKGEVIGSTPIYNQANIVRGNEILGWIRENEKMLGQYSAYNDRYVIFDDDSEFLYWQRNNFIHIDRYCGLSPSNVYQAVKILNRYDQKNTIDNGVNVDMIEL
jgi:hypothetical protein